MTPQISRWPSPEADLAENSKLDLREFKVLQKEAPFVAVSASALLAIKVKAQSLCQVQYATADGSTLKTTAIAYQAAAKVSDNVVQVSNVLKEHCNLSIGQDIELSKLDATLELVSDIWLFDLNAPTNLPVNEIQENAEECIATLLQAAHDTVLVGQKISLRFNGHRDFRVMRSGMPEIGIAKLSQELRVHVTRDSEEPEPAPITIKATGLGGLDARIAQLQEIIDDLTGQFLAPQPHFYEPSQGVLLYGPKGTGKTALIKKLEESSWATKLSWARHEELPKVTRFPALICITDLDKEKENSIWRSSTNVHAYKKLFDSIRGSQVLVVAETRHPNDVHESLRAESYFETEIELPVPTANDRAEIMRAICYRDEQPTHDLIDQIAEKTHGYVGADLRALLKAATLISRRKMRKTKATGVNDQNHDLNGLPVDESVTQESSQATPSEQAELQFQITFDDFSQAMTKVRPSALQEVVLETPHVRWSDIGGQHEIKRRLKNAVERPLKQADRMKQLNGAAKKGILLYGPPGCSKTLMVKALANEAELNFLAVKGAELISKYVGESEAAIREVFQKARAASPSIIFFDEIDSIASIRNSELNVLTTLLTEMDGFEELRNVLVVAATNKPQHIDPALMRPGRLDNIIYVGPPDAETRKEILQNWFAKSRVVGVEPEELAGERTDGYSGAELTSICQTAVEYAMDDPGRDHIMREDFDKAIEDTPKGITQEMRDEYDRWRESRK